jgi:hypothetical protein
MEPFDPREVELFEALDYIVYTEAEFSGEGDWTEFRAATKLAAW